MSLDSCRTHPAGVRHGRCGCKWRGNFARPARVLVCANECGDPAGRRGVEMENDAVHPRLRRGLQRQGLLLQINLVADCGRLALLGLHRTGYLPVLVRCVGRLRRRHWHIRLLQYKNTRHRQPQADSGKKSMAHDVVSPGTLEMVAAQELCLHNSGTVVEVVEDTTRHHGGTRQFAASSFLGISFTRQTRQTWPGGNCV